MSHVAPFSMGKETKKEPYSHLSIAACLDGIPKAECKPAE